ncbi:FAD-dependent oxidoreductase [Gryllotalpicola reticulitermitis]|uniref:FAD-dependent oxidoreductase n=1 Tax=Gryllotalpicola reticulitermitis TaxID=1184153 RepID=A0ABV8Q9Y6_9MICO
MRVVVIGYGPVGARFVEELLPAVEAGGVELTVVGAEPHDAYNRVLMAEYAVGRSTRERLETTDTESAAAAGVQFRLGAAVVAISPKEHVIHLQSDDRGRERLPYDRLVFATGARANVPTLDGLERSRRDRLAVAREPALVDAGARPLPRGIVAMRTLEDAETVRAHLESHPGADVVVLGAGVLGMEFALAAAEVGASVAVVYHDGVPMGRNLDQGAGRVLARLSTAVGIAMHPHARAEEVLLRDDDHGRQVFDGLVCADGTVVRGSLLVLSCGASARTELAAAAGLRVAAGIVVDEELRSWSDPDVYAIGDCAQSVSPAAVDESVRADPAGRLPGGPSGLVGPGWRQAAWLAARLADESLGLQASVTSLEAERPPIVMLKAEGLDVVAAGNAKPDIWDDVDAHGCAHHDRRISQWADPLAGRYLKLITEGDRVTGFACVGLPRTGAELTLMFEQGAPLPADRSVLLRLDGPDAASSDAGALGPESVVCTCNGVTAARITDAAAAGCVTIDAVGRATRAGTGCGGCHDRIQALIDSAEPVRVAAD